MQTSDPMEVWDQAVESARQRASTTISEPLPNPSCRKLKLRREPQVTALPLEPRRIDLIAPDVRAVIRGLVGGVLPWPLFLHGPAGVGKTCAVLALHDLVDGQAYYHPASEWVDLAINVDKGKVDWRGEGGSVTVTPQMFERRYRGAALVILDELATRDRVQDWHYEKVKALLDWRSRLPFIIISNLGTELVGSIYDDRLASRIASGTVLELPGDDRRIAKA